MKIKRLTFSKLALRAGCILVPLLIMYHWVPSETRLDFPFVYMGITLIVYEFGKFVGYEMTRDEINNNPK